MDLIPGIGAHARNSKEKQAESADTSPVFARGFGPRPPQALLFQQGGALGFVRLSFGSHQHLELGKSGVPDTRKKKRAGKLSEYIIRWLQTPRFRAARRMVCRIGWRAHMADRMVGVPRALAFSCLFFYVSGG